MSERKPSAQRASRAPQRIGAILPAILGTAKQQHGTLRAIQQQWGELVGKGLAAHTKPVSFRRGRLVIQADRSGDSFTLNYQREQLLNRLRESTSVEELVIRVGAVDQDTARQRRGK